MIATAQDPTFVQKIHNLEDKRQVSWKIDISIRLLDIQDLYLSILRKHGQIVEEKGKGTTIVSYPQVATNYSQMTLYKILNGVILVFILTLTFSDSSKVPQHLEEGAEGLERQGEDLAEHFPLSLAS